MTERPGGSGISQKETKTELVNPNLNLWHVSGFKLFSSATDANMALLLACTRNPNANDWIEVYYNANVVGQCRADAILDANEK